MQKLQPSYVAGRNVKCTLENSFQFLKRLNIVTDDAAIPLLGIYPRELNTCTLQKLCTRMFKTALLIIFKIRFK